jgi:hypothetical protein
MTLSELAGIDSGSLSLALDEAVYPESVARTFAAASRGIAVVLRSDGRLWLHLTVTDPRMGRLEIGNALTDLLKYAVRQLQ